MELFLLFCYECGGAARTNEVLGLKMESGFLDVRPNAAAKRCLSSLAEFLL